MRFKPLSGSDMKAMGSLKESHGGAQGIADTIENKRDFETRKKTLAETEYGAMIDEAEELVKRFAKVEDFEEANDNHLVYLDGITRAAKTTGANFFLNPSWSTIIAICYYGRDIPNLYIKISMMLATQNLMQFRMLLNIMNEYLRDDMASPIREINIGNGVSAANFIKCSQELDESGIKGVDLAAHILINPDLGRPDFNWYDDSIKVLENGCDLTFKYESDGQGRELDTTEAYFLSDEERRANALKIGDVIYHKTLQCTKHAMEYMKRGIPVKFGQSSRR